MKRPSDEDEPVDYKARYESLLGATMEACKGSGYLNAHELRVALERSKASAEHAWRFYFRIKFCREVLREEVNAWRNWYALCGAALDKESNCECEDLNRVARVIEARAATDRTESLSDIPQAAT